MMKDTCTDHIIIQYLDMCYNPEDIQITMQC